MMEREKKKEGKQTAHPFPDVIRGVFGDIVWWDSKVGGASLFHVEPKKGLEVKKEKEKKRSDQEKKREREKWRANRKEDGAFLDDKVHESRMDVIGISGSLVGGGDDSRGVGLCRDIRRGRENVDLGHRRDLT